MSAKTLQHRLEYGAVYLLGRLMRRAPRSMARGIGAALGWLAGVVFRLRRRVVDENLAIAFADKPQSERDRIARGAYVHFGKMAVELIRLWRKPIGQWPPFIESIEGTDNLKDLVAREPHTAVLVTGHLGIWEILAPVLTRQGFRISMVAKPIHNPYIEAMFREIRGDWGEVILTDDSMKKIVRLIKEKWVLGLAADQDARKAGIFIPFFGRPASTAAGPAFFAIRFGLRLLPTFAIYTPKGTIKIIMEAPLPVPEGLTQEEAIKELTRLHTLRLEERIRETPEQYWWFHRRWKTAPD
ncbi:MAG: lysophospholipid acyltransferase family protein [Candidatus Sumerlaeota bacterium]|nr:lysophospholipid acyltransferase family protein [Candidatus Sumerlaeota bacterium]